MSLHKLEKIQRNKVNGSNLTLRQVVNSILGLGIFSITTHKSEWGITRKAAEELLANLEEYGAVCQICPGKYIVTKKGEALNRRAC